MQVSFQPELIRQLLSNNLLWQLLSLSIREGGLGLVEPSKVANYHYLNSVKVTTPFVSILTHESSISVLEAYDEMMAIISRMFVNPIVKL